MPSTFFANLHFEKSSNPRGGRRQSSPDEWPREWTTVHFKAYPRFPRLSLQPSKSLPAPIGSTLSNRRSRREYGSKPITLPELSNLLSWSAGLQPPEKGRTQYVHRTYASGGARFPLEIYPLILRGPVKPGLYHYNVYENTLEQLWLKNFLPGLRDIYVVDEQKWAKASVLFLVTAVFPRNQVKYKERGYRYVLMEAGHLGQNVYLVAEALGLQCSAVGGFVEEAINELLDVDGIHESIIYTFSIGK